MFSFLSPLPHLIMLSGSALLAACVLVLSSVAALTVAQNSGECGFDGLDFSYVSRDHIRLVDRSDWMPPLLGESRKPAPHELLSLLALVWTCASSGL